MGDDNGAIDDPSDRLPAPAEPSERQLTEAQAAALARAEGRMSLGEHIRELRSRLLKSVAAIVVGTAIGWIIYHPVLKLLVEPFRTTVADVFRSRGMHPELTMTGVADPLTFQMKISLVVGLVLACPVWLYQMWAFIAPGLHRSEKRWAYIFTAGAVPLFFAGIALAYYTLPKGLTILIGFTQKGVQNLIELPHYLDFTIRTMLVFGVSFQMPLVVILLSWTGVLSPRALSRARPYVIVAIFIFGAVATPSGDPVTLCMLAIPMTALYVIAEVVARMIARRRAAELDADSSA